MAKLNKAAIAAGQRQENEVSFYLDRAVGNYGEVDVFYNVKLTHNGHNAQIDHLVLHPAGIIIIESKSVTGEVKVNAQGEWSRSYRGNWAGMSSPILQAENQLAVLRSVLAENFKFEGGVAAKASRWLSDVKPEADCPCTILVAVSSNAIIHRQEMPSDISEQVVKTEFIGSLVDKLAKPRTGLAKVKNYFLRDQRKSLAEFFDSLAKSQNQPMPPSSPSASVAGQHLANSKSTNFPAHKEPTEGSAQHKPEVATETEVQPAKTKSAQEWQLACKHCGSSFALQPKPGKFGYYVACGECKKNTPMKSDCPACKSKETTVKKKKNMYILSCSDCSASAELKVENDIVKQTSSMGVSVQTQEQEQSGRDSKPKTQEVGAPIISNSEIRWSLTCKHCNSSAKLTPKAGKLGYYVACGECKKNTPMKSACPNCKGKEPKVSKQKNIYTFSCPDCSFSDTYTAEL